jgi:hypothetical protein
VIQVNSPNFDFISVVTTNQQVVVNVNKLDLEEVSSTCDLISNVDCSNTGVRVY